MKRLPVQIFLMIVLVAAAVIYIYDPIALDSGWPSSIPVYYAGTGLFKINPGTILESLDKGNTDVFLPDTRPLADRADGPALYNEPILWSQSDYLKVGSTLGKLVWEDSLDNWSVFSMIFNADCQNNLNGLSGSDFQYFKTIFDRGKIMYSWREIEIDPEYLYIAWGDDAEFVHPLFGLKSVDLNRLKISAEAAVRIAEENGGREARLSAENQCNIHLLLMPERFKGWRVDYQSTDFEIEIDPYTGEVIK
jgi:hypothetical protein